MWWEQWSACLWLSKQMCRLNVSAVFPSAICKSFVSVSTNACDYVGWLVAIVQVHGCDQTRKKSEQGLCLMTENTHVKQGVCSLNNQWLNPLAILSVSHVSVKIFSRPGPGHLKCFSFLSFHGILWCLCSVFIRLLMLDEWMSCWVLR